MSHVEDGAAAWIGTAHWSDALLNMIADMIAKFVIPPP